MLETRLFTRGARYRLLRYLEKYGGAIDVQRDIISPVQALREARRLAEESNVRLQVG